MVLASRSRALSPLSAAFVVLAARTLVAASAHAAPPVSPAPPPPPPTSVAASSAPVVASTPTPTIATPAPGASESNVEKAQEVAKVAAKTPIVPNPKDATRPAFQLYAEMDLPVLGIGLVFAGARLVRAQPAYCSPLCNPADLNALDRVTAGRYSPAWSSASDYALYGVMAGAAALLAIDEGALDALNDSVVVAESALSATAVNSIMTIAAGRPRPFLYSTDAPLADRQSSNAALSFLSSHTAIASAITASTFMAMKRLHPRSSLPYLVLAIGEAATAFIGTARVMAGMHFITDVTGGFVVGSSVGILIPALHDSPVKLVPVVSETQRGFNLVGAF